MKIIRYISIILISILIYLLLGCANNNIQVSNNPENNKKMEVTINSEISEYSPLMSSTPGIPLTIKFKSEETKSNMKFHWITEQGTFLNWEKDKGKINVLGNDIIVNDQKVYWSIDPNSKINKSSFKIYLKIEDSNTSKEISQTSIEVKQNKEGIFSIKE